MGLDDQVGALARPGGRRRRASRRGVTPGAHPPRPPEGTNPSPPVPAKARLAVGPVQFAGPAAAVEE